MMYLYQKYINTFLERFCFAKPQTSPFFISDLDHLRLGFNCFLLPSKQNAALVSIGGIQRCCEDMIETPFSFFLR